MKIIFIDIETLPLEESKIDFIRNKVSRRNTNLSSLDFEIQVEKLFRETALQGSLGRLLCIGLMIEEVSINYQKSKVEDSKIILRPSVFGQDKETRKFHLDEKRTLEGFWNYLSNAKLNFEFDLIVGHNLIEFDLPFIYQRSMVKGVKPTYELLRNKPWEQRHLFDTMKEWKMGVYGRNVSLEDLAFGFGVDCQKDAEVDGSKIYDLYLQDKHEEIREYCLKDIRCIREVYYRMNYLESPKYDEL
ncbi:MAG: ribonuclease H-like domain-containing protein [Pyrinomonadaceae bacterium]|nr:ribonuclease H-like domain-containing protein [Pyrinomonadaceae bacterium]MCX7640043.1 ribonuclease H-like domain-containing protein [Pyrinomonadaceae bacterium]MDW8304215.1 ribonuclease H-like domain-containing protein [Acidobacteriota bacterium]